MKNVSIWRCCNNSIALEDETATWSFWASYSTGKEKDQKKKEVAFLVEVLNSNYQGEGGLLLHSGDKEDIV